MALSGKIRWRRNWARPPAGAGAPRAEAACEASHAPLLADDDPPFDAPDSLDEALGPAEDDGAPPAPAAQAPIVFSPPPFDFPAPANDAAPFALEEEPPFDAPELGQAPPPELAPEAPTLDAPASPPALAPPAPFPAEAGELCLTEPLRAPGAESRRSDQPAPPISIHVSCDRPAFGKMLGGLVKDKRLARTEIEFARGGFDGAIARAAKGDNLDLIIVETTLNAPRVIAALERLAEVIGPWTKVIVIGVVNDIGLLRELNERGVSEYIVAPVRLDDLAGVICGLYAESDKSRVFAVIGARGGVGASTIARNIAWSIAERQDYSATLVDLDLPFGAAAFSLKHAPPEKSVLDAVSETGAVDEAALEEAASMRGARLHILSAPASPRHARELDAPAVEALIAHMRRKSPYVVLDLPHAWNAGIRQALVCADEVLIVAGPDLASLRNAENMVRALGPAREHRGPPLIVLSMLGVPKRPEIPAKDFAEALHSAPIASFQFEPALYDMAAINGQTIGEAAPHAKAASALDALATALTGHAPRKAVQPRAQPKAHPKAQPEAQPEAPPPRASAPAPIAPDARPAKAAAYDIAARQGALAELIARHNRRRDPPRVARRRRNRAAALACLLAPLMLGLAWQAQTQAGGVTIQAPKRPARVIPAPPVRAAARDPALQLADAQAFLGAGASEEAITLLRAAAEAGYAPAQHRLAQAYERGEGVGADLAEARRWTARAAEAGLPRAMHDLGVYFASGEGGARDDAAAFRWFRQGADYDIAASQFNLGVLYRQGRGVAANAEEALFWFLLAAGKGEAGARAHVEALETELAPMQVLDARARAEAFQPRLAPSSR